MAASCREAASNRAGSSDRFLKQWRWAESEVSLLGSSGHGSFTVSLSLTGLAACGHVMSCRAWDYTLGSLLSGGQGQGKALLCLSPIPGATLFTTETVGN